MRTVINPVKLLINAWHSAAVLQAVSDIGEYGAEILLRPDLGEISRRFRRAEARQIIRRGDDDHAAGAEFSRDEA